VYVNEGIFGAGFIDVFTGDVCDFTGTSLSTWDGVSPIGPISVNELFLAPFDTTSGSLTLTHAENLTFSASQPVVAPDACSTWMLMLVGLAATFTLKPLLR